MKTTIGEEERSNSQADTGLNNGHEKIFGSPKELGTGEYEPKF